MDMIQSLKKLGKKRMIIQATHLVIHRAYVQVHPVNIITSVMCEEGSMRYRCCNCGEICEIYGVEESRGEFWGFPCKETIYYSDCCNDDFEEVDDEEDEEND